MPRINGRAHFSGKRILVTGGTGLIGRPLCESLRDFGAEVRIVSLDDPARSPEGCEFLQLDLTDFANCMQATRKIDYAFHLAGIKGSPKMTAQKPASFFYSTISFNTHMLEAARRNGVEKYMFTSSVGVYAPAALLREDDVWSTFPSPHDTFAGWAKRMGELQLEAYKIEHDWQALYCVRPANVYGPFDNFDIDSAMVVPSLIQKIFSGEDPLVVWGDGSSVRDFIFSEDCAEGILQVFLQGATQPVNLGSGQGVSIKTLVETLIDVSPLKPKVQWDTTKPTGDRCRLLDVTRAKELGFVPQTPLASGLRKTVEWFVENRPHLDKRYNVFR